MKKSTRQRTLLYVLAVALAGIINIFGMVEVDGFSMFPTYSDGDLLIYSKVFNVERDGIYIFEVKGRILVKRAVYIEGDTFGMQVLQEGEYAMLGDNRDQSVDSRDPSIGIIKRKELKGRVIIKLRGGGM